MRTLAERFHEKVTAGNSDECWPWKAARDPNGYGRITTGSKRDGTKVASLAHRVAWEVNVGPIPDGKHVLHRCDNPPCCNPTHLFLGDITDNNRDMWAKGRGILRRAHTPGEKHGNSKLTDDIVLAIRRDRAAGATYKELASKYGIIVAHAGRICRRVAWKHLP